MADQKENGQFAFPDSNDDYIIVDGEKKTFSRPPRSWQEAMARSRHTSYVSLTEAKRRKAEREAAGEAGPVPEAASSVEAALEALPTPLNPEWRRAHGLE
ncbi:MAG: hypothetical protein KHY83_05415 [Coriobacteriia bacterium]|nr:hypothetical protein [Coriobacteriia bacterium]MBS5478085.1 hypothetical protein [Coriobacteriia bacterium]